MKFPILAALAAISINAPIAHAGDPMQMTYTEFEASVPHLDLEECPAVLAAPGVFCRISLASEAIHVFVFSENGDQPLVGFRSWEEDDYEIVLK